MNLKQAASRLGIHYQTVYKLVRSGALPAVRVGGTYDISEGALARYVAEREALVRDRPANGHGPRRATAPGDPAGDGSSITERVRLAVAGVTLTAAGAYATAARELAAGLGDLAVVQRVTPDGKHLEPVAYDNLDPRHLSLAVALLESFPMAVDEGFAGRVVQTGEPLFWPHVPQDRMRAGTKPEFVQYLDEVGVHSLIEVPMIDRGAVVGTVIVSRDRPGRPYLSSDVDLVRRVADVLALATRRAEAFNLGWRRRSELVASLEERLGSDPSAPLEPAFLARALQDRGPLAEIVCDTEGRVLCVNRAAARLGGLPIQEFVGRDARRFVADDEIPDEQALFERLVVGEIAFHDGERTFIDAQGQPQRLLVHRAVLRTPDATPRVVVLVAHPLPEPQG